MNIIILHFSVLCFASL